MPRQYQSGQSGGASMSGHSYEPQVTPWHRGDDDVAVGGRRSNPGDYQAGQYRESDDARRARERDAYNWRDAPYANGRRDDYRNQDNYRNDGYRGDTYQGGNDRGDAYNRRDLEPSYDRAYDRDRARYSEDYRAERNRDRDRDNGHHNLDRDMLGNDRDRHHRPDSRGQYGRDRDYRQPDRYAHTDDRRAFSDARRPDERTREYDRERIDRNDYDRSPDYRRR